MKKITHQYSRGRGRLQRIISHFNELGDYSVQNKYLTSIATVIPVGRRRSQNPKAEASFSQSSYSYRVRVNVSGSLQDTVFCYKVFLSLHICPIFMCQNVLRRLGLLGF
ncbi:unnamed protein product [Diabrotica balteata]|uniref:Uncharacterized protein n=1 Tax=Diabrotica balteata TaxID=107213 RepID=A0A9N9XCK6_DIABA|nr:unnamed protein product [Diabrotica balteata]